MSLGTGHATKSNEFSEKFQDAHPRGKGGSGEEGGDDEDGGGDEKGEESPVDGFIGWTRLGKEGRLPQDACVILQLCFLFELDI